MGSGASTWFKCVICMRIWPLPVGRWRRSPPPPCRHAAVQTQRPVSTLSHTSLSVPIRPSSSLQIITYLCAAFLPSILVLCTYRYVYTCVACLPTLMSLSRESSRSMCSLRCAGRVDVTKYSSCSLAMKGSISSDLVTLSNFCLPQEHAGAKGQGEPQK